MQSIRPLKRFGQNYLNDPNILNKIEQAVSPSEGDNIIEIGPGLGALTEKILHSVANLTAVEIDTRAAEYLNNRFKNLNVIREDFLKIDLDNFIVQGKKLRIIGNIPYNITSPILFKLLRSHNLIKDAHLMVQFEVAKRMTAEKGVKDYGILSILLKRYCAAKLLFRVPAGAFYPKPNVESALVRLDFREIQTTREQDESFITVVKAAFSTRRKKLKNSFGNSILKHVDFSDSGIDLSLRAEQLDTGDFMVLADFLRKGNFSL